MFTIPIVGDPAKACQETKWHPGDAARWRKVLRWVQYQLEGQGVHLGEKLGQGSYGTAFRQKGKPNNVVKITGDPQEIAAIQRVYEAVANKETSWRKLPALTRPLAVQGFLNDCNAVVPVYCTVQEFVPGDLTRQEADFIDNYNDAILDGDVGPNDAVTDGLGKAGAANVKRLYDTVRELARIGVNWGDLHSGNVRKDAVGHWKIIDLGLSRSPGVFAVQARSELEEE